MDILFCPMDIKLRKWPYLGIGATKHKNKGTFFSPTFKVREGKVVLVLSFSAPEPRYGHFLILSHGHKIEKMTISPNMFIIISRSLEIFRRGVYHSWYF